MIPASYSFQFGNHSLQKVVESALPNGVLLQDATQVQLDVLPPVNLTTEAWTLVTPTTIKNWSVKCRFLIHHVSSNDGIAVKLSDDKNHDWYSLQTSWSTV
jgi:hypothetical protein